MTRTSLALCAALAWGATISPGSADQPNPQQLSIIRETAVSICNTVKEAKGQKTVIELHGDIKVKLSEVVKRLVDAGGSINGSIIRDEFEGLTQEATALALEGDRGCRERVFNKMFDRLSVSPMINQFGPNIGWLHPGSQKTPETSCNEKENPVKPDQKLVFLGKTVVTITENKRLTVFKIGECSPLSVVVGPDGISIDAEIYSLEGKYLGKIINNGYNLPFNNEFNVQEDMHSISVHDKSGNELIYVEYINDNAIRIRGIFTCLESSAKTLVINNSNMYTSENNMGGMCIMGASGYAIQVQ